MKFVCSISLAFVITLSGCSNEKNAAPASTAVPSPVAPPASIGQPALPAGPKPQTLDLQLNHPNGMVVRVTEATFGDDNISAKVTATNGSEQAHELAAFQTLLRDDQGVVYRLATSPSNRTLAVQPASTIEFSLVFLGRISPKATSLTIAFNDNINSDNRFTNTPTVRLGPIPVQR